MVMRIWVFLLVSGCVSFEPVPQRPRERPPQCREFSDEQLDGVCCDVPGQPRVVKCTFRFRDAVGRRV